MDIERSAAGGETRRVPIAELPGPLAIAVAGLDWAMPHVDRLARLLVRLAVIGVAGALVPWVLVSSRRWPVSAVEAGVLAVAALVLLVPAGVLLAYRAALLRYGAAADRLRTLPDVVGEPLNRVHRAADGVRAARHDGVGGTVRAVRHLVAVSRVAQQRMDEYAQLAAAANPPFIAAAAVAAGLAVLEAGLGLVLLFWTTAR